VEEGGCEMTYGEAEKYLDWLERFTGIWDDMERYAPHHVVWLSSIYHAWLTEHDLPMWCADELRCQFSSSMEDVQPWDAWDNSVLNVARAFLGSLEMAGVTKAQFASAVDGTGTDIPDLVDANGCMLDAFERHMGYEARLLDEGGEPDSAIMLAAWELAKEHKYFPELQD